MTQPQTILITGATAGIGRQAAIDLARSGHRVFATGRRQHALEALTAELADTDLHCISLDVTSAESIEAARAEVDRVTGGEGLDVLINNAGYGHSGPTIEISDADMRAQYDTNVFGLMAMTRAFVPTMRARGRGRIVNVSSIGGRFTFALMGVYNSTKYAVESLSDALRVELHPFGIDVVLIEPGYIKTEFGDHSVGLAKQYTDDSNPYQRVMARIEELNELLLKTAVGPEVISAAIQRAVEVRRPRARYVAPFSAKVMVWFMTRAPTRLIDWASRMLVGLTPKGMKSKPPAELPSSSSAEA